MQRRTDAYSISSTHSISSILALLLGVLLLSGSALAADFRALSSTYARGTTMPGASDTTNRYVPFLELLQLDTKNLGLPGLSVHASLWGRVDLADVPFDEERATGDVNVLSLSYRAPIKSRLEGLTLRLGRQFVAAGPSVYDQIDGIYGSYRSPWRVDLTAYGGWTTGMRFTRQPWALPYERFRSNWVGGGRLGYRLLDWANLGVADRQKRYAGQVAFNEVGWDATVTAIPRVTLITDGVVELTAQRLKEARAIVRASILRDLSAVAGYRLSEPDLFIPRTSIFAVFSSWSHQELFGEAYYTPQRWLSLSAEVGALLYGETCIRGELATGGVESCDGGETEIRAELRADLRFGIERQHRASVVVERLGAPEGGYTRGRLAGAFRIFAGLSGIAEVDLFYLDARQGDGYVDDSGHSRFSFSASGYLGYRVLPTLTVLAGGQGGATPYLKNFGTFLVRINWLLDGAPIAGPVRLARSTDPTLSLTGGMLR